MGLVGRALVDQLIDAPYIDKIITLILASAEHVSSKVCSHVVDFDQLEKYAE